MSNHLESNFCRERARLDITDVDTRLLRWTTGDADAHTLGAHKAEKNLLLLDFFASNGRQACNAAFFLLWQLKKVDKRPVDEIQRLKLGRKHETTIENASYPRLRNKLVNEMPLQGFI